MAPRPVSPALRQFVDDELVRAPLLFDQLVEGTIDHARKDLPTMTPSQRTALGDLMTSLQSQRARLSDYFIRSLREQVSATLSGNSSKAAVLKPVAKPASLALVEEDEVMVEVEISHAIQAVKSVAEYELRELQTFVSALVGDMDVAADHNPFRPETFARATWAAAQALPLSRGHQVAFLRHSAQPMAQLLRKNYAAACSRLENMGVEPAAHRTLILPSGSRRGARGNESTFSPDLQRMRETMPGPLDDGLSYQGQMPTGTRREQWREIASTTTNRVDRQAIELVSRLFDAMMADERVPPDVLIIISRLHGPAMRLTLRDGNMLDEGKHPLWRFINRLVFEAEMAPDPADPERAQLLLVAQSTAERLAAEPEQNTSLYRWALDRLESFLHKRLTRRLTAAATQIGVLQKLEEKLRAGHTVPSTGHGTLDVQHMDTVPADLMDDHPAPMHTDAAAEEWLDSLRPGDWVRMFMQGRWVQCRLLWPGERREILLFGDGASDATWAVRRGALLMMHSGKLAKTLKQRSIVGTAAIRVQEQVAAATPSAAA